MSYKNIAIKRVSFAVPWMGGGGIERVRLALISGFLDRGYDVDLVLTEEAGNFIHLVPEQVHVELFECTRVRQTIPRLRDYMRRRKPDAMIVALWPLTVASVIARMFLQQKPRLILSDHNHLTTQYSANRKAWAMLRTSLRLFYPKADALVGVSSGVARNVSEISGLNIDRVATIYNPTSAPQRTDWPKDQTNAMWQGHQGPRIISAGRFKSQKNHSLLLRAFAKIQRQTGAKLMMLGEGELENKLRAEIAELGITEHVVMPGFVVDPSPYYASADVFALSSDYEGFGNVLVEAMYFGLKIVSTDCRSGPSEILENGRYGSLVPIGDSQAFAAALIRAIKEPAETQNLKKRAADFSIAKATSAYERLAFPEAHDQPQ